MSEPSVYEEPPYENAADRWRRKCRNTISGLFLGLALGAGFGFYFEKLTRGEAPGDIRRAEVISIAIMTGIGFIGGFSWGRFVQAGRDRTTAGQ